MLTKIQRMFALSRQGAKDLIKGCIACILQNLSLMVPVSLLYILVSDLMGGEVPSEHLALYIPGCAACLALILLTTWFQYNATYFATYIESGVRRISLAEKLRRLPLSFFGKKDLADLTSTIMADCTFLEQSFSHFVPELIGSIISTTLVAVSLFVFDWRMALAALWVVPVSFAIVFLSFRVQDRLNQKQMAAKIACADGIQECLEAMRDLKSNNAEGAYLAGLDKKIRAVEKRAIVSELGTAVFVVSASLILKLGIATVIGDAIIDYLKNGRLDSDCDNVFIRHIHPYGEFHSSTALSENLKRYMKYAGMTVKKRKASHSLRHTLASSLLYDGTPLMTISNILGHNSPKTTSVYTKVDLPALRKCALSYGKRRGLV